MALTSDHLVLSSTDMDIDLLGESSHLEISPEGASDSSDGGITANVLREILGTSSSGGRGHARQVHKPFNRSWMYQDMVGTRKDTKGPHHLAETSAPRDCSYDQDEPRKPWCGPIARAAAKAQQVCSDYQTTTPTAAATAATAAAVQQQQQYYQRAVAVAAGGQQQTAAITAWARKRQLQQQAHSLQPSSSVVLTMSQLSSIPAVWNSAEPQSLKDSKPRITDSALSAKIRGIRKEEKSTATTDLGKHLQVSTPQPVAKEIVSAGLCHSMHTPPLAYLGLSSAAALKTANNLMGSRPLLGGMAFCPVSESSLLFQLGQSWSFTAYAICLGSSYFQRLVDRVPSLDSAVRSSLKFANYVPYMRQLPHAGVFGGSASSLPRQNDSSQDTNLQSILFTCVYIATKIVDRMPYTEMLQYMLTKLHGTKVTYPQAYEVECKCLDGLQWRLGPYFIQETLEEEW